MGRGGTHKAGTGNHGPQVGSLSFQDPGILLVGKVGLREGLIL